MKRGKDMEPTTKEETRLGIPAKELNARYSYYSQLVRDRTNWEQSGGRCYVDPFIGNPNTTYVSEEIPAKQLVRKEYFCIKFVVHIPIMYSVLNAF